MAVITSINLQLSVHKLAANGTAGTFHVLSSLPLNGKIPVPKGIHHTLALPAGTTRVAMATPQMN